MSRWRRGPVFSIVVVGAAVLLSGVAVAGEGVSDEFFDRVVEINPTQKYQRTSGFVDGSDDEYATEIVITCLDNQSDLTLSCMSDHPDLVSIKTDRAKVAQRDKGNSTQVRLQGTVADSPTDVVCSCEKATQSGQAVERDRKMKLECELKRCDCRGDLGEAEMQAVDQCFSDSNAIKLKLDNGLIDAKIKSAGIIATF